MSDKIYTLPSGRQLLYTSEGIQFYGKNLMVTPPGTSVAHAEYILPEEDLNALYELMRYEQDPFGRHPSELKGDMRGIVREIRMLIQAMESGAGHMFIGQRFVEILRLCESIEEEL